MDALLHGYSVNQPTWFYLSLLLIIAVYFRFTRVFSLRNVDLLLLLSASPGLIFVEAVSPTVQWAGHRWLLIVACLFLVRLFIDPVLSRRPYLGQNLNPQGMGFLCASAFAFLMTQAITEPPPAATQETISRGIDLLNRTPDSDQTPTSGPTLTALAATGALAFEDLAARVLAILGHAAVVVGLWFVGRNLFADKTLGLAMATLYLLLPCTAYNVGEFNHVLPAALIVWAFVWFRRPIVSGVLLGLACGSLLFPVFLLPIWASFYGRKGAGRFAMALGGVAIVLLGVLALTSSDSNSFLDKTVGTINIALVALSGDTAVSGFWTNMDYLSVYRLPVMVAYFIMLVIMTVWLKPKTVEALLAQSTAAVVGTQLWYTQQGGVYLLWYLPLMLMVVFRPRLLHLRNWSQDLSTVEQSNISPSRKNAPVAMTRGSANRNLQLFR